MKQLKKLTTRATLILALCIGSSAWADPVEMHPQSAFGWPASPGQWMRPAPLTLLPMLADEADVFATMTTYSISVGWMAQGPVLEMSGTIYLDEGDHTSLMVDVDTYRLYGLVPTGLAARIGPKWVATPGSHWFAFSAAAGPFFVVDIYADQQMQGMGVDGKVRFEYGIKRWPIVNAAYQINKGATRNEQVEFSEIEVALVSSPAIDVAQWLLGFSVNYHNRRGSPWNAGMWNEHGIIGTISMNQLP